MFKIAVIGPPSVGKTTWFKKILKNVYEPKYIKSFESTYYTITHQSTFECLDVPSYKTETYLNQQNNMNGVFIMCVLSHDHLDMVKKWKLLIHPHIKTILIINKLDIEQDESIDLESFCVSYNIDICTAITIKDDFNILEPFEKMHQLLTNVNFGIVSDSVVQIIELLLMSKDMEEFKIKYLSLIYKNPKNKNFMMLNDIIVKYKNRDDFLNYLIDLYRHI